ncbi:MAG TPA: hypothetical protein VMU12_03275 [Candidatus Paceibacterota bacterium]|nr:hypothetical protein [Candidatus Paceibacterota bacterium]
MLRPISERLRRRAVGLIRQDDAQVSATGVVCAFLQTELPKISPEAIEITYDEHRARLTIVTRSKALASELLLRAPLLAQKMRDQKLQITHVVIR